MKVFCQMLVYIVLILCLCFSCVIEQKYKCIRYSKTPELCNVKIFGN